MKEYFKNFWFNLKRTSFDILVLAGIIAAINFLPPPESGVVTLFLAKILFVSAGILVAHITRKLYWSYISFSTETDNMRKLMIIVWYASIIFAVTRGG